jgi:hypothetical protein
LEATVICVHGEGGRERAIATAKDQVQIAIQQGALKATPDVFADAQNVQPTVVMVLRDAAHDLRLEVPLYTWAEVEALKTVPGVWDDVGLKFRTETDQKLHLKRIEGHERTSQVKLTIEA